jgi:4-amino-4-deoxychorismate lyase
MYRFFESIAIVSGKPRNLFFHQARIDRTFKHFYPNFESHHLEYLLSKIKYNEASLVKCKFSYDENTFKFYQLNYPIKKFSSFFLVTDNNLQYSYKLIDRSALDKHQDTFSPEHQFILIKNNKITDSGFSNLLFYDGYRWLTPAKPLLAGTMRASLLAELRIFEEEIEPIHLPLFKSFKLINALNSFEDAPEYPVHLIK